MDILVAILPVLLTSKPVLGFGIDPKLQIDIINELDLANATFGITQVAGLHNNSKAFLFRDVERAVHAPAHITEKVVQLFRNKSEFTFLASIQQKSATSGIIFSIHESEHSYFEMESSGLREEIRYRYRFRGKPRSESFPYRLADGQWHKIALSISASHLLLHIDCNRTEGETDTLLVKTRVKQTLNNAFACCQVCQHLKALHQQNNAEV